MKRIRISSQYFRSYCQLFLVYAAAFFFTSCGVLGPLERNYEFAVASPSQAARAEVRACFQQLNQLTGLEMVHVASEHTETAGLSDKQSQVHIIPGVEYTDPDTNQMRIAQAQYLVHSGSQSTTMKVMFDWDTFRNNGSNGSSITPYNLRTCAHEVGHGMGLKHIQNAPTRIMNPTITNQTTNMTWSLFRDDLKKAFQADSPNDV